MFRTSAKLGGGLLVVAGLSKAAYISANEDWDLVQYRAEKYWEKLRGAGGKQATKKSKIIVLGSGWGALSFIQHLDEGSLVLYLACARILIRHPFFLLDANQDSIHLFRFV